LQVLVIAGTGHVHMWKWVIYKGTSKRHGQAQSRHKRATLQVTGRQLRMTLSDITRVGNEFFWNNFLCAISNVASWFMPLPVTQAGLTCH